MRFFFERWGWGCNEYGQLGLGHAKKVFFLMRLILKVLYIVTVCSKCTRALIVQKFSRQARGEKNNVLGH